MKRRWVGAASVLATAISVACTWGTYDRVYTGPDGGVGQACGEDQSASVVCADGLTCLNGICAATCTDDDQCPSGQRCLPQGVASCGSSSCTINACVTASEGHCDCPGTTCVGCNGSAPTSCAPDEQCRTTCSVGASISACLPDQTCIADSKSCQGQTFGGPCSAHCYGSAPHDTLPDASDQ